MDKNKLIKIACELIGESLGQGIAEQYRVFYHEKTEADILLSIKELMGEVFGPENAQKKLIKIKKLSALEKAEV